MSRVSRQRVSHAVPSQEEREIAHTQNFLTSRRLVERLVERAAIGPDDVVLEIGPGRGIITEALARRAGRVIAVEKDAALAQRLARRFADVPTVSIVAADFLDVPLPHASVHGVRQPAVQRDQRDRRPAAGGSKPAGRHAPGDAAGGGRAVRRQAARVAGRRAAEAVVRAVDRAPLRAPRLHAGAPSGRGDAAPAQARPAAGGACRCPVVPRLRQLRLHGLAAVALKRAGGAGRSAARPAGCPRSRATARCAAEPRAVRALAAPLPDLEGP